MGNFNLYSVNWQDGMLITQQHLKDQERYFEELVRWSTLDLRDRYGLVRKSDSEDVLSMSYLISGNKLHVEITKCQALTPDGHIIAINESNQNMITGDITVGDEPIPVFIGVNPTTKKQVGNPDAREDVPRIPYLVHEYTLALGEPPNLPEAMYVPVARFSVTGGEVTLDESYYPPCQTITAHDKLAEKARNYRNRLESLLALTSRAYLALAAGGAMASERTELQTAFRDTVYNFGYHLAGTLDEFLVTRNAMHPLQLVTFFKKLFRVFSILLNFHPGLKDYLNEKYFTREANSNVGSFLSAIDNFLLSDYDHRNITEHIRFIDELYQVVHGLFAFMTQVEKDQLGHQAVATETVTYQGKTYRMVEYSGYKVEESGGLCYLMVSIPTSQPISDMVILLNKELFTVAEWNSMQVRLGLNEARGLGETDPVNVDTVTFGNKVAMRAQDMVKSSSVNQVNLIFRGMPDTSKFEGLGKSDLIVYTI